MHFIIDENIPQELAVWLEKQSHQILCVAKGSSDEEIAALAQTKDFILLTLDRHFANTLKFPPKNFAGIVRIKIHPSYIEDITFSLKELFRVFTSSEDLRGKLFILEKDGYFKLKE